MTVKSDIEIARETKPAHIEEIARKIGLDKEDIELYGKYKAKIDLAALKRFGENKNSKLVLVTAINPTPAGEGKTTVTIGLGDAFSKLGQNAVVAVREPSLGPVFGLKGGATGGGYAQVIPMDDINLHFTGDMHAITSAVNLLAAMLDNHIHQGNSLKIDTGKIVWKRCLDMNDRQLRNIVNGLGGRLNGVTREDGFDITVASEVMAILCLSDDLEDLQARLSKIVVAYTKKDVPITCGQLGAHGAMTILLKDAVKPNIVQTLEQTPAFVHGGPFANIAHGCSSLIATKAAMKLADIVVTEAGFGADLGAEKFLNIKCRKGQIKPSAVVIVATVRALKYHGGVKKAELPDENVAALQVGFANLQGHIDNMTKHFSLPVVVALNRFFTDTRAEIDAVIAFCDAQNVDCALTEVWEKGGEGGVSLAQKVMIAMAKENQFSYLYEDELSLEEKVKTVATKIYGAKDVLFSPEAKRELNKLNKMGCSNLPICIAKTQYSFSDNPKLIGRPKDFDITVKNVRLSAGAGFVVMLTGDIMTMPGLPKIPAAEMMQIDKNGKITGLS